MKNWKSGLGLGLVLALSAQGALGATAKPIVLNTSTGQLEQIQTNQTLLLQPSVVGNASLNIPQGTAPTSANNGDVWMTSAGLWYEAGGTTYGPLTSASFSLTSGNAGLLLSPSPWTGGSATITLEPASASVVGGLLSATSVAHEWVAYVDNTGTQHQTQPAFSDISGTATATQLPTGSNSALGVVECDGTTINCSGGGVISAINSGQVVTLTASESISSGALVSIWNNSGTAQIRNANATDGTKTPDGFVEAAYTSGQTVTMYLPGQLITGLTSLTPGNSYFLATSNGAVTGTAPSSSGNWLQLVGKAVSATSLLFQPQAGVIL